MQKPALVIMAAGLGSRYGGLKQAEPVGPHGELIIDYSIHDAMKAGFGRVICIIKPENREIFEERIGRRHTAAKIEYACGSRLRSSMRMTTTARSLLRSCTAF